MNCDCHCCSTAAMHAPYVKALSQKALALDLGTCLIGGEVKYCVLIAALDAASRLSLYC